jgi:hypothetical protein
MEGRIHHVEEEEEGDDESDEGSDDELSGNFINDGNYTQHGSQHSSLSQHGMYLALNRRHMELSSPLDDACQWGRNGRYATMDSTRDSSFSDDLSPVSSRCNTSNRQLSPFSPFADISKKGIAYTKGEVLHTRTGDWIVIIYYFSFPRHIKQVLQQQR